MPSPLFCRRFSYLLANEASLRDLQNRCPASVSIEQFRPNLLVTGAAAWEEDTWKVVRIGEVILMSSNRAAAAY